MDSNDSEHVPESLDFEFEAFVLYLYDVSRTGRHVIVLNFAKSFSSLISWRLLWSERRSSSNFGRGTHYRYIAMNDNSWTKAIHVMMCYSRCYYTSGLLP